MRINYSRRQHLKNKKSKCVFAFSATTFYIPDSRHLFVCFFPLFLSVDHAPSFSPPPHRCGGTRRSPHTCSLIQTGRGGGSGAYRSLHNAHSFLTLKERASSARDDSSAAPHHETLAGRASRRSPLFDRVVFVLLFAAASAVTAACSAGACETTSAPTPSVRVGGGGRCVDVP